jgi:hypothetical protein
MALHLVSGAGQSFSTCKRFWLTIAYRFGDGAVRLLDLEDSSQHDWAGFAATELLLVVAGED